jgi:2-haloacid dehalogenase
MSQINRRTFVFDAYGTLFDVHAAIARHRTAAGTDADRFSELWRLKQLEYSWTLTLAGRYVDFWTLTQRALDYAFERLPSVDRGLREKLLEAYFKLDPFSDARTALQALKDAGHATAILSNGSPEMLEAAVAASGFSTLLDAVLSVDSVKMFKPRPEVYALVTDRFAVKPSEVVFVSSNRWDVMGAAAFGFRAVWINRARLPDEYPDARPARTVGSLSGLDTLAF